MGGTVKSDSLWKGSKDRMEMAARNDRSALRTCVREGDCNKAEEGAIEHLRKRIDRVTKGLRSFCNLFRVSPTLPATYGCADHANGTNRAISCRQ